MLWLWQIPDWPRFRFRAAIHAAAETAFLKAGGVTVGASRHLDTNDAEDLTVSLITAEAFKTSEIEGELLDRDSLQSSIRRELGLATDRRRAGPAEQGIAALLVSLLRGFDRPLDHEMLCQWHRLVLQGRSDVRDIGRYRHDPLPMQVVSGPIHAPKVHYEAPPSSDVPSAMQTFIDWFHATRPDGPSPLPALTRAALAHLHFVAIHPFEDGNGRIARALSEMALSQGLGEPSMTALSVAIEKRRKAYYGALAATNHSLDADDWIAWFGETALAAQTETQRRIAFLIAKTRLLDRLRGQINPRQEKALLRVLREGPDGFTGGLSAGNYSAITGATPATAGRDLSQLVALGALHRTGEKRGTRYWLMFDLPE